jgi:hypothetical protein
MTVADWADATRADGGLAIFPHFPYPDLESVADLLCGKLDGVEVLFDPLVDGRRLREWYRFLNLGVRVPLVTGTDKMGEGGILGEIRTYTYTGSPDIDFEAWAAAIRVGRTVVSVGALMEFTIDGELPGATLEARPTHVCRWRVRSSLPVDSLEIVANGAVVHQEPLGGEGTFEGSIDLALPDRGWIAARCSGAIIEDHPDSGGVFESLQVGAHSSPHYMARPADPDPVEIARLRVRLEGALGWGRRLAVWEHDDVQHRFETLISDSLDALDRLSGAST